MFSCPFSALQPEQELDLAQLAEVDTQDATEYGKRHTLELLKKIREQLTEVGLQDAALLEDVVQKYILAVSIWPLNFYLSIISFMDILFGIYICLKNIPFIICRLFIPWK